MLHNTIIYKYSWYGRILYTPGLPALWKNEAELRKTVLPPTQPSRAPFQHNVMFGFAFILWTQGRFRWRFKMHFHHLLWKVSLFAHRQQDSKACHVCCRAGSTALTMAQRVHLPVSTGKCFLRTGSEWGRIFHLKVENMHLLKHIWGLDWLNCMGFPTGGKEHCIWRCSD